VALRARACRVRAQKAVARERSRRASEELGCRRRRGKDGRRENRTGAEKNARGDGEADRDSAASGQTVNPRQMASRAVLAVSSREREALELSISHDFPLDGLARVLGMPAHDTQLLLIRARESFEQAPAGEILLRSGGKKWPDPQARARLRPPATALNKLRRRATPKHAESISRNTG
jgi:hypothetical protein